jgi:hypothetical protein
LVVLGSFSVVKLHCVDMWMPTGLFMYFEISCKHHLMPSVVKLHVFASVIRWFLYAMTEAHLPPTSKTRPT